jgi:hypothetical protein
MGVFREGDAMTSLRRGPYESGPEYFVRLANDWRIIIPTVLMGLSIIAWGIWYTS